jgi:phenylacetate-coenzyme A ligase PaaK-like adenylate-forming protein
VSDRLLRVYHRLPGRARSVAASLRGLYLRTWRYGAKTEQLVEEALERDHWSAERWQAWREQRLAYVLHRAATRVPYYQEHWAARRQRGDKASWELLANWPVLERDPVRAQPAAFVADQCNVSRMFCQHTSGSSGLPLTLWWSRETVRLWYALFEARARAWYGVSRRDRWAMFGGQLVAPFAQRRPPFWVWNAALNQLYVSSYHLAPELIPSCIDALRRYRVAYVFGYTSSLYAVAQEALVAGSELPLRVAVTNAEPVLDHQREAIARAFLCPVRETYGMAELVAAASECEAGRLHLWPEVGWVEIMEGDGPSLPGQPGELVCTGLLNTDMPLIRYRVGDRGAQEVQQDVCSCGRRLPALAYVEGRNDDVLYTLDGRRVGRLDPVFKGGLPLREAQIVQESLDRVKVRYVPLPEFTTAHGRSLIERLQARMGSVRVTLEEVELIPRTRNGKFRAVICNLPPDERQTMQ